MVFATLLLLLPVPQNGGAPAQNIQAKTELAVSAEASGNASSSATKVSSDAGKTTTSTATDDSAKDATLTASVAVPPTSTASLPSMPAPKANSAGGDPAGASAAAFPVAPVKPAIVAIDETPRQRKIWYALAIAGHSGAAFDAWSTRRAISAGAGTEGNPMLRPFVHSNALYAATQVSPLVMDFLGKRMMTSQHKWVRRMWWLPQTAGASVSFTAGAHNVGLVH